MLMFLGKPAGQDGSDENASRAARLKALRQHFFAWKKWSEFAPDNSKFSPVALAMMLRNIENETTPGTAKRLRDHGSAAQILVLNAHGSARTFSGYTPSQVADMLVTLGVKEAGTREIWLAACNNGHQTQDNSSPEPFAVGLMVELRQRDLGDVKVYAPRGILSYGDKTVQRVGSEDILHYGRVYIRTREDQVTYDFDKGWVLAHV